MISDGQLEQQIIVGLNDIKAHYKTINDNFHMANETVNLGGHNAIKTLSKYGFLAEPRSHEYSSFQQIGWPDPFPLP